jgi:hypothetical protein
VRSVVFGHWVELIVALAGYWIISGR